MDTGKDEGSLPQSSGPPSRKKFVIPLEEDEIPPAGVRARTWELLGVKGTVRDPRDHDVSLGLGYFGKITCCPLKASISPSVKRDDRVVKRGLSHTL